MGRKNSKHISKQNEIENRMDKIGVDRRYFYNLDYVVKDAAYTVSAMQYHSYDYFIGKGNNLDEAIEGLKRFMNVYDVGFKEALEQTAR